MMHMIRTFIYGSCVSRDTFAYLDPRRFSLLRYVARQSLISAFTAVHREKFPEASIDSPFQRRMVEGDWRGSFVQDLRANAEAVDLILWDLCDERHGVRQVDMDPPAFVTRSVESISSGIDGALSQHRQLNVGEPEHFELFCDRLANLTVLLTSLGLQTKLLVVAPAWASTANDGTAAPKSFTWTASDANRAFAPYYSAIAETTHAPIVNLPDKLVVADANHRWGAAPFHYIEDAYQHLADAIGECVARSAGT